MRPLMFLCALLSLASCNTSSEKTLVPHCYASSSASACECTSADQDSSFKGPDFAKTTSCEPSKGAVCCAGYGDVNDCACAVPHCTVGPTGECLCNELVPSLSTETEDMPTDDCNPDGTMDCCIFSTGVCMCMPGHNDACDADNGARVADCTAEDASVVCADEGLALSMQVLSCNNVTYTCTSDADCSNTCENASCARCLEDGHCLCGSGSGNDCSY